MHNSSTMRFVPVTDYPRQAIFDFFRPYPNPFYSITFELDATALRNWCKENGYPVYLNLCYFLTRAAQEVDNFHYRMLDGELVRYDHLHIGMTVPSADGLWSFAHYEADPDPHAFNRLAATHAEDGRGESTLDTKDHTNFLYCTAIPGVSFTAFVHATPADTTDGAPRVAFGKFIESDGRLKVPVGLTVNHIFIDGADLGTLAEAAEDLFADPR